VLERSAAGARAMGGQCCSERKDAAKDGRKSVAAFNGEKGKGRAISIGYHSRGDDAEKFDKAFEENDLKAFVSLLASDQKIEKFEERMHPWAEDPRTVGALAGTQLAILASVAEKDNPRVKDEIREAGAITPLVGFLKSGQEDRIQTAVVALSFLTAECSKNADASYKAGAMPELLKHLDAEKGGMRAAAATTLRNICVENVQYRAEFARLGGVEGLVRQLNTSPDPALNHADVQLEAVLNLQDIIEDDSGAVIPEYATAACRAGALDKLNRLMKAEPQDEEVRSSAEEVINSLQKFDKPRI